MENGKKKKKKAKTKPKPSKKVNQQKTPKQTNPRPKTYYKKQAKQTNKQRKKSLKRKQGGNSKRVDGDPQKNLRKLRSLVDFDHFLLKIKLKIRGFSYAILGLSEHTFILTFFF